MCEQLFSLKENYLGKNPRKLMGLYSYLAEFLWKSISPGAEVVVPQKGKERELGFLWQKAVLLA